MRRSVSAVAGFLLAACQSLVTTTTSYDVWFRSGVLSEFGYAATAGEMPVVVVGNPFDVPKPAVDEAVIAAMQGHNRGSAVRFVQAPADIAQSGAGYAVVMLLNAGPGIGADVACARRGSVMKRSGFFSVLVGGTGYTLLWSTANLRQPSRQL